jgi:HEAT repeat protein
MRQSFVPFSRPLDEWLQELQAPVAERRRQAALALGKLGDSLALHPLVHALEDADAAVRSEAASALASLRRPESVAPLLVVSRTDPDPNVRLEAMRSLGCIVDPRAEESLLAARAHDPDPRVRGMAAWALDEMDRHRRQR